MLKCCINLRQERLRLGKVSHMENLSQKWGQIRRRSLRNALLLALCCVAINTLLSRLVLLLGLPIYLDSVGTILAGALGGYLPGIVVGYATNLIGGAQDPITAYYASINVLLAVIAARFYDRGGFRKLKFGEVCLLILLLTLIGGGLGSVLTWLLYDFNFGEGVSGPLAQSLYSTGLPPFLSQLFADILIDLPDKLLSVLLTLGIIRLLPDRMKTELRPVGWRQAPLDETTRWESLHRQTRSGSLRRTSIALVVLASLLVAVMTISISVLQFRRTTISQNTELANAVTTLVSKTFDHDRVLEYIEQGEAAEGYLDAESNLYTIRDSSPNIEYVYVYRILSDGCHVVFDLDTEDIPGGEPGEVVPFDESFTDYLPALLAGEAIEPLITNDTYGWLLTVYQPVYDSEGNCVCYAAADISMGDLSRDVLNYLARAVALSLGLLLLILFTGLWLAEYHVVLPINSLAWAAGSFAYNSEASRSESLETIRNLGVNTGDEIENLYKALEHTTEQTVQYIADVQEKNQTISRMQNGLILVLADMVESRDQCTGDHVRKTAAYTRIIMEQMRKEGIYADKLTDEYIEDVVNSAPLHDVGKIQVSDTILNKPGKLTDEEFAIMKSHTTAGGEVISHAIALVSDAGYLEEAKNLATYHHERWDGKGYPTGLKGEEIPLSARIMAVADVFDALVSRRSYKAPFTFEKAMDIIREEAGTHFDPLVAKAFLDAEPEVRRIAEEFHEE